MTTIEIYANDQDLQVVDRPKLASGDENSVQIHVEFNSEWDDYVKTGVFFIDKKAVYEKLIEDNSCVIPHEVLQDVNMLHIGIRGVNGDKVKTSALIEYRIFDGAPKGNAESVPPTSDVYNQLLTAYENAMKAIEKYKTDLSSENDMFKGNLITSVDDRFREYESSMNASYSNFTKKVTKDISDIQANNSKFQTTINTTVDNYMTDVDSAMSSYQSEINASFDDFKTQVNEKVKRVTNILSQASEPDEQLVGDFWFKTTILEESEESNG